MDAPGFNAGAKAALGTIKESIEVGREAGKLVEGMQADVRAVVAQQHQQRLRAREQEEQLGGQQERRAYRRFMDLEADLKATEQLKREILGRHGKKGWDEFLRVKSEVERQDLEEAAAIHTDEDRIADLAWWCFGAAGVVVYFLVLF